MNPVTSGEGALDPIGLATIGDRLADQILPGLRARMHRPRFLTATAVGAQICQPIHLYMPYVAETQDEKMFRVVRDRDRWFQIVMGENYEVDEAATDRRAARIPLPTAIQQQLAMRLHP